MGAPANTAVEQDLVTQEIGTAVKHTFVYGIGGILVKAISFLLLPLYTHYLSPRDYGLLEILDLSMSLLGMFLNMGITAALLRYYGIAASEEERKKVVSSIFLFTVFTGLLILLIGSLLIDKLSFLLLGPGTPSIYLFLSLVWFVLGGYIANIPYTYLRAKEASGTLVALDAVGSFLILALNVYLVAALRMSVMGLLISPLIIGGIKSVLLISYMGKSAWGGVDWRLLRRILAFGAPLIFSNLTMFTLNFSDRFFLQHFLSLEAVGVYAVGYKFGYMVNFLFIQPFNMMWQTRMYLVHKGPDHQKIFSQVFVLYSLVLIFAALALALYSSEIMRLMVDPRYAAGEPIIALVALAYVFLGIGFYFQLGMFLKSRTGLIGIVSTISAVITLTMNFLLVSHFGLLGAAWATILGFLAIAIGTYYCSERVFPLHLPVGRVCRGLVTAMCIYFISRNITLSSVVFTVLAKSVLLAGFVGLIYITRVLSGDELETLSSFWRIALNRTRRVLRPAWLRI